MFGGVGIYSGEIFFALIADDTVYFKVDESTRADFEARGMGPFRPFGDEGGTMKYYQLPEEVLEDPEALRPWAEKAVAVARQNKARRPSQRVSSRPATRLAGPGIRYPEPEIMAESKRLIDVSHTIEHGMTTYKGFPAPINCDWLSREASRTKYA